jgi:hypothetical protein
MLDELVPEQETPKPEMSPTIAARIAKNRTRDVEAQEQGTISLLYDLKSRGEE